MRYDWANLESITGRKPVAIDGHKPYWGMPATRSQGASLTLMSVVSLWHVLTVTMLRGCPGDSVARDRTGGIVSQIGQHVIDRIAKH